MLVGRLCKDPVIREVSENKRVADLVLAVQRPFKTYEGEIITDFIPVTVWDQLADLTNEYTAKGQTLLVKGRIVPKKEKDTLASGVLVQNFYIQADRVVFLSNTNKNHEGDQ